MCVLKYCPIYDVVSLVDKMRRTGNQGVEVIDILTIIPSDSHEKIKPPFPVNLGSFRLEVLVHGDECFCQRKK